jgi:putative NADH-flavin reductase
MRIALLGAHGKTGRLVAESARSLGHALQPLQGNVLELKPVRAAIHGADVVISTLGPVSQSPPHLCSRATWQVLEVMTKEGVGRLVMVTGAMCGPPENLSPFYRALLLVPSLRRAIEDRRRQEALVKHSLIGWTLVRPPRLTDEDTPGDPEVTQRVVIGAMDHASRRHVAETLMRAATTGEWRGMGVYVRS